MDPETKKLLEETHALAKENHRMLSAIRRDQWFNFFGKIIIWAIVLLLPIYLYHQYLAPIVAKIAPPGTTTGGLFGLPSSAELQKLIDSYKAKAQ
ncbi:hypothetical protein HY091_02785 [Candidatus Kaiserbacteria bacterium]|nr:hypothetical protein [Candidatus Kaiserbacteria bacterium]